MSQGGIATRIIVAATPARLAGSPSCTEEYIASNNKKTDNH